MVGIAGIGIRNFRSIGNELQLISPLKKVTFLAGRNNAGKSNTMEAFERYLASGNRALKAPANFDVPQLSSDPSAFEVALGFSDGGSFIEFIADRAQRAPGAEAHARSFFEDPAFRLGDDDGIIWIRLAIGDNQKLVPLRSQSKAVRATTAASNLSAALTNSHGGNPGDDSHRVLERLEIDRWLPKLTKIEAFRQIRPGSDSTSPFDYLRTGENLVEELQKIQNPVAGPNRRELVAQFRAVNQFVKEVFEDPDAEIEIPHDLSTIVIRQGRVELPVDRFGTGISHVIMIAAAASIVRDSVICIEEPEVHLHPTLQRQLIQYLRTATENHYLITTHSASMLDHDNASVFHVDKHPEEGTVIRLAKTPSQMAQVTSSLGYRPSDLLQANAVIWVEGPSDRIYVRKWIRDRAPEFIEGIHFSIMFYGGRLLNHLTVDDPEVLDFISLRRLNRNLVVLIDSDRKRSSDEINETKERVRREFDDAGPGFAWVTFGNTIENYIDPAVLAGAIKAAHGREVIIKNSRWQNPLTGREDLPRMDKIKIAKEVVGRGEVSQDRYDLAGRIADLVDFIRSSNESPTTSVTA